MWEFVDSFAYRTYQQKQRNALMRIIKQSDDRVMLLDIGGERMVVKGVEYDVCVRGFYSVVGIWVNIYICHHRHLKNYLELSHCVSTIMFNDFIINPISD